ncbi:MAG: DUF1566 domain-containing protein, partial [Candidatus Nitrotoga sp.]
EVTDQNTGLIWRRCPEGMTYSNNTCTGAANKFTHEEALRQAATQASGSGMGWRLPTLKELLSQTKRTLSNVKVDSVAFPATPPGQYWTASRDGRLNYHLSKNYAWTVDFTPGLSISAWYNQFGYGVSTPSHYTFGNYVRLVRDGPVQDGQLHANHSAK